MAVTRTKPGGRTGRLCVAVVMAAAATVVLAAGGTGFLGRVVVEWNDTDLFNRQRLVLIRDFGYQDTTGHQWIARKGVELDGSSFSPLFEELVGQPFVGEHRRAGIMHDYFAQQLTHDWKQVKRMYYEALLSEGLSVPEAKTAYAILYGSGMRWEVKGSTCYVNCHSAASALRWKPDVTEAELEPVFALLNEGDPDLDELDRALDAAVPKPGPHLFSQLRPGENGILPPSHEVTPPGNEDTGSSQGAGEMSEPQDEAGARKEDAAVEQEGSAQEEPSTQDEKSVEQEGAGEQEGSAEDARPADGDLPTEIDGSVEEEGGLQEGSAAQAPTESADPGISEETQPGPPPADDE